MPFPCLSAGPVCATLFALSLPLAAASGGGHGARELSSVTSGVPAASRLLWAAGIPPQPVRPDPVREESPPAPPIRKSPKKGKKKPSARPGPRRAASLLSVRGGQVKPGGLAAGRSSLLAGRWEEAEQTLKAAAAATGAEAGGAHLALAELYTETGRTAEARQQCALAGQIPAAKAAALCLTGEIEREIGKTAEAIRAFQAALKLNARDLRARVYLGITYVETGQKDLADRTLGQFFDDFNAGRINKNRADELTYTAMAARYLESWMDANHTFQDAAEKDPNFILANLEWGELFLLKYRADEALKCFQAVLKVNPNHARALVGVARVREDAEYDVAAATKLADQALKSNPTYAPALNLKAQLALDDEQFSRAETLLKKVLAANPVDLQALSLLAASRYLQEDLAGYDAQRLRALRQNPRFSRFYFLVGELAVRQHRYSDAVTLNRQAIALDPDNADALAGAGTNLLRMGIDQEAEAMKMLDRAFQRDGFNVRTFNTLNLYEQVIAKEYQTVRGPTFVFRLNKKEQALLTRYVPQVMQRAWDLYVKKYEFTPKTPITVELFTERQHYGARTTGLPEIGAQGTCFGPLITAMSPASAEASWDLVLWHELAHVFHLQLSNSRAPRWFTEGLSEYETNIEKPYWKREYGREIYLSLRRGELWKIGQLSSAFTHPDRPNGVLIAYQQSSLVIHYLVEKYGFPKIVAALKLYAQGKHDGEVLPAITGKPMAALDQEFQDYLLKRYAVYTQGFLFDPQAHADIGLAKKAADDKPADAAAQANLAAALLVAEMPEAIAQARKALGLDPKNALARYVLGYSLLSTKDPKAAKTELESLLAAGVDGSQIRLALGRIAAQSGDLNEAAKHLNEVKKLDPDRTEPFEILGQLYEMANKRDEMLKETEGYLELQEHDHTAARLLVDRYAADKRWADLARVAPKSLSITPNEGFVHQQYGIALVALGKPKEAIYELESALVAGMRRPAPVRVALAQQYLALKEVALAREAVRLALIEEPNNTEAMALQAKLQ